MNTPPKGRLDHILDFFFGTPKRVKGTIICTAIVVIICNIDQILQKLGEVVSKIMVFVGSVINAYAGVFILILIGIFLLKKVRGK